MKLKLTSKSKRQQAERIFQMIFDIPLSKDHPKYELQKIFYNYQSTVPHGVQISTTDFYNNGEIVSVHFKDDAFIISIDTDKNTMESAILSDYDNSLFETFEVTSFTWDKLTKRINLFDEYKDWSDTLSSRSKTIKVVKEKLGIQ